MSNPELNPNAKTPPKPSTGYASDLASIPAQSTHTHMPNFPGEPNPSSDTTDIPGTSKGADHGWFHS